MYLRSLRINGFKSFADPTLLAFEQGTTAIVGPNGCGKSNIADAIRWVLGEQSAKALRGGKMVDVIFEGTDTRKPLPLCEVSLLLTECEKQLGSDFHDVEITRRVSRDGASDYFLNGKACRLKDIQKLFMDTGVGRSSYSVMAQGQIDQVLSSRPEERREIFEEAAGITRYKAQRREALQKLAATEANLSRVNDVTTEVGRQIGSLRRQAAKAVRYQKLAARLRHLDLAVKARQHAGRATEIRAGEAAVERLSASAGELRATLEARQAVLAERRGERSSLQERLQAAQQSVFDLRSQREAAQNQGQMARVRQSALEDRLADTRAELAELERALADVGDRLSTGARDQREQAGVLRGIDQAYQQRQREVSALEAQITEREQRLQRGRLGLLEAESAIVRRRSELTNLEVERKTSAARQERLAGEVAEAKAAVVAAAEQREGWRSRVAASTADQERLKAALEGARQESAAAQQRFREGQRRIQEADRSVAQKTARLSTLRQLAEKFEGFGDGAKALLQGRLPAGVAREALVPVPARLRPGKSEARALEAILGGAVEAIAVAEWATARALLAHLEQQQLGRAGIYVAPAAGLEAEREAGEVPPGLRRAAELFLPKDPGPGPDPASLLEGCYVADSLGDFLAWRELNPGFRFRLVATVAGELVDSRGLVFGGHLKGRGSSILQREVELAETARELAADQASLDRARAEAAELEAALARATGAVEEARRAGESAAQAHSALVAEERTASRAVQEAEARAARLAREEESLADEAGEAHLRFERLRVQMEEAEGRVRTGKEEQERLEQEVVRLRAEREARRDALATARLDLAEKRQRLDLLDRGVADLSRRQADLGRRKTEAALALDQWSDQVAELAAEADRQAQRAVELAGTLEVAARSVEEVRVRLIEVDREITAAEAEQSAQGRETDRLQAELRTEEVRLAEARSKAAFLVEDAQREYQADLQAVDAAVELWRAGKVARVRGADLDDEENPDTEVATVIEAVPAEDEKAAVAAAADWAAVTAEAQALKTRVSGMGPVNLVAIAEYRELKQRHDFLRTQTDDLVAAKAQLVAAIDEINRVSLGQFRETFEQVRKNFTHTFHTLFGGGHVELELVENPVDPLDSGIEIVAQPPGTKLKALSLLSGGQKALTAVALLFAIYLVKPSPFCLLDELDAPLDESNIGRFTSLLRQFSSHSQFLIITHNKRTISAARAIYGVTMPERGVSKVVSMKFQTDRHEALTVNEIVAAG